MDRLVNFITDTGYKNLPEEARQAAKNAIVDWVGVAIAGASEPAARIAASYARRREAIDEAGVIGGAFRTSAELAAWVNGTAGHALDFDDTFPNSTGYNFHPTAPVLPAVLALGQRCNSPGVAIITAYVAGIEVESRVGAAVGRYNSEIGWHPTPVVGTIGAAAACANILRLNGRQARAALGIAGSLTGGLVRNFGTMTKPLHAGNATRNGVVAALLAKDGFTANDSIMEGENGFCSIFSGGRVTELGDITQDLGERWHIVSPGMSFKAYPCCRSTHSSIDASFHLRNRLGLDSNQVAEIICKTSPWHTQLARFHRPKSGKEGKFSIPYCIATALLRGKISLGDFTNEKVADGEVQALLSKVKYLYPVEYRKCPSSLAQELVVKFNNGAEYSHKVDLPKGEPANPMTDEELLVKFIDCASLLLPQVVIEQVRDTMTSLESLDDISKLIDILTFSK
jgi:2-methylcitrate dehydratase PrpD